MMSDGAEAALGVALGHDFVDPALARRALTHPSAASKPLHSYERLEFLGDRVLGLVLAELLFAQFPKENQGDLARRLAALADRDSLAHVARAIGLGDHLIIAEADAARGVRENPTILADGCEAAIAALYLDGGLEAARAFVTRHWTPLLERAAEPPRDAKTSLQEWAQARGRPIPEYVEIARSGPAHQPVFTIEARLEGVPPGRGEGPSKRAAEQRAARAVLDYIDDIDGVHDGA